MNLKLLVTGGRKTSPFFILQLSIVLAAFAAVIATQKDFQRADQPVTRILVDADLMPHMVLGFNNFASDILWVRVVQEFDFKDHVSDGWVFHLLDAVTNLDPRFKYAYDPGATVLSVLVHDAEGARKIFDKGLIYYPKDWSLAYRAGYHYLFEIKDCHRAAELMKQAEENGAPHWLAAMSARLFAKSGQMELARAILTETMKKMEDDSAYQVEFKKRLDQLDAMNNDPTQTTLIEGLKCN